MTTYTGLFKNRNFLSLWLGQFISAFGDRIAQMGILAFVMIQGGDRGDKMALITFFSLLPFLLLGPLCGALVDKFNRRNLMIVADLARALLVIFIPALWLHTHSLPFILLWFFLLGTFGALFSPAKMSIITNIIDRDSRLTANSLVASTGMVATLVGTLFAGALISGIGIETGFLVNTITYLISAFFILKIRSREPLARDRQSGPEAMLSDMRYGLRYIRRHGVLLGLLLLNITFSSITSFSYILVLHYGSAVLKQNALGMGALLSSAGLGMIAGAVYLMKKKNKVNFRSIISLAFLVLAIALGVFVAKPGFVVSLALALCAGFGVALVTIVLDTIFQRVTPDELRGKIFAARGVVGNGAFLATLLLAGFLVTRAAPAFLFVGLSALAVIVSLRIFLLERKWGYQIVRGIARVILRYWFSFKVSGYEHLPKKKKVILAANHTSLLDGVAIACAYPGRIYFLALDSLFKMRLLGWFFRRLGYIPIKRGGFNKQAFQEAVELINSGYSLGIFPEGKISQDGKLAQGKEGIAVIAKLTGATIVPCAIEGAYEAWPLKNKYPRKFPVEVRFEKPIDVKEYATNEALVKEVMESIAKAKLHLEREGYLRVDPNDIIRHIINIG